MKVESEHGVVCSMPKERFGYFGWPTVTKTPKGRLIVGASGLRLGHVCPWGKTVLFFSDDSGRSWSYPRVINDTPLDDRDCGILSIDEHRLLVTWFSRDSCMLSERFSGVAEDVEQMRKYWADLHDERALEDADRICRPIDVYESAVSRWRGAWCRLSRDGGNNWGDFVRTPVNSPHGPNVLNEKELIYMGKQWDVDPNDQRSGGIQVYKSGNEIVDWEYLADVPLPDDTLNYHFYEPHVVKLKSGRLIGVIRYQYFRIGFIESKGVQLPKFSEREKKLFCNEKYHDPCLFLTMSEDEGKSWTMAKPISNVRGVPGHLLEHSSGALICCFSYRIKPYGIRCVISFDKGESWSDAFIIRDDGVSIDLGYPSSVELADGRVFTVYYQQVNVGEKCSLLYSIWKVPKL